jgi:hypothetical protein
VGCLGGRAHLFPDRVCEPILHHAAMGTGVSDQTSAGAGLSGTRTSRRGSVGAIFLGSLPAMLLYREGPAARAFA